MSCEVAKNCMVAERECWHCRFNPDGALDNCYVPLDKSIKHPVLEREKAERKQQAKDAKKQQKVSVDKGRSKVVRAAAKAEEKVRKTLNSGRVNRDGDLTTEDLGMDVKLQTTRTNPVIDVEEFDKCQNDARRAGKHYGVLIIENKEGRRFYVLGEDLFSSKFI